MLKDIRIRRLKSKLKHSIEQINADFDRRDFGWQLFDAVSSILHKERPKINKWYKELKKLDPKCPPLPERLCY